MTDFIQLIENNFIQLIKEMGKGVIDLTCVGMMNILEYIPDVQRVDEEAHIRPFSFLVILGQLRTKNMCNEAMRENPVIFFFVPDCFKTQEMCNKTVNDCPCCLKYVPNHLKTREMCKEAVDRCLYVLQIAAYSRLSCDTTSMAMA